MSASIAAPAIFHIWSALEKPIYINIKTPPHRPIIGYDLAHLPKQFVALQLLYEHRTYVHINMRKTSRQGSCAAVAIRMQLRLAHGSARSRATEARARLSQQIS